MKTEGGRQCHSTAGVCLKDIVGLEGVELGANGKVWVLILQNIISEIINYIQIIIFGEMSGYY